MSGFEAMSDEGLMDAVRQGAQAVRAAEERSLDISPAVEGTALEVARKIGIPPGLVEVTAVITDGEYAQLNGTAAIKDMTPNDALRQDIRDGFFFARLSDARDAKILYQVGHVQYQIR